MAIPGHEPASSVPSAPPHHPQTTHAPPLHGHAHPAGSFGSDAPRVRPTTGTRRGASRASALSPPSVPPPPLRGRHAHPTVLTTAVFSVVRWCRWARLMEERPSGRHSLRGGGLRRTRATAGGGGNEAARRRSNDRWLWLPLSDVEDEAPATGLGVWARGRRESRIFPPLDYRRETELGQAEYSFFCSRPLALSHLNTTPQGTHDPTKKKTPERLPLMAPPNGTPQSGLVPGLGIRPTSKMAARGRVAGLAGPIAGLWAAHRGLKYLFCWPSGRSPETARKSGEEPPVFRRARKCPGSKALGRPDCTWAGLRKICAAARHRNASGLSTMYYV